MPMNETLLLVYLIIMAVVELVRVLDRHGRGPCSGSARKNNEESR